MSNYTHKILLEKKEISILKNVGTYNLVNKINFKYRYSAELEPYDNSIITYSHKNYSIINNARGLITTYDNIMVLLKMVNLKRILMDIKDYNSDLISNCFISKEIYDKAVVFINKYKSTNGSNMTLVMIDLSKIKLKEIKIK